MAFYKKKKQKVNGLWYPMAVTVGKPVNTDEGRTAWRRSPP